MKCKFLLSTVSFISALILSVNAIASDVNFTYTIETKHGVDLSNLTRGPLQLQKLNDARTNFNGSQIGNSLTLNQTVADVVSDAIAQGFNQGGAILVESNPSQVLSGDVIEFQAENIDENGEQKIQVTVRAKLKLHSPSGKNYWQSTVMGRSAVAKSEGVNPALQQALDKLVGNLFYDDYFLIQLIE